MHLIEDQAGQTQPVADLVSSDAWSFRSLAVIKGVSGINMRGTSDSKDLENEHGRCRISRDPWKDFAWGMRVDNQCKALYHMQRTSRTHAPNSSGFYRRHRG